MSSRCGDRASVPYPGYPLITPVRQKAAEERTEGVGRGWGGWVGREGDGTSLETTVNCCVPLAWDVGLDTPLKLQSTRVFCRAKELC